MWTCTYNQPLLCCNYLQAVPCDPAGADFNFAALSFNSEFLHQIHLIPLHGCSPAEKQAIFMLSAAGSVARDLKERRLAGWKETGTILITTFLLVCLVMRCDLRHSLGRPTLAACPPPTSLVQTLSTLVSCHVTHKSPVFNYIRKQTCKTKRYHRF